MFVHAEERIHMSAVWCCPKLMITKRCAFDPFAFSLCMVWCHRPSPEMSDAYPFRLVLIGLSHKLYACSADSAFCRESMTLKYASPSAEPLLLQA